MIKDYLSYDPATGLFHWMQVPKKSRVKVGDVAGGLNAGGYLVATFQRKYILLHRLAFVFMGEETPRSVDHANGIRTDNRWDNLRGSLHKHNIRNREMGQRGYTKTPEGRFRASIQVDGVRKNLGTYDSEAEAAAVYEQANRELHGEYSIFVRRDNE